MLAGFIRTYPQIELDLNVTDRTVDGIEEGFDAVIRSGEMTDSRLTARKPGIVHFKLVASPDYLKWRGVPQQPYDLINHLCLRYRYSCSGKLEPWSLKLPPGEPELILPASMIRHNIEARLCFALTGLGIAYLPDFPIREALPQGRLMAFQEDYRVHEGRFYVLWPASKHLAPKVRVFVDDMHAHMFAPAGEIPLNAGS